VDKIESIERMLGVLDAAVHVHTASRAGMPLNGRVGVNGFELLGTLADAELVAAYNGDLRELRARGLPALGASAHVIIGALACDGHFDRIARAFALERPTRKIGRARLHAIVYRRMN
jgi:hypothetical protein